MQRFTTEIRPLTGWKINADYTFRSYTSKFTSNNFICYEDMVDGTLVPLGTTVPSYVEKNQQNNIKKYLNDHVQFKNKMQWDNRYRHWNIFLRFAVI